MWPCYDVMATALLQSTWGCTGCLSSSRCLVVKRALLANTMVDIDCKGHRANGDIAEHSEHAAPCSMQPTAT